MEKPLVCPICDGPTDKWGLCKTNCYGEYEQFKRKFPQATLSTFVRNRHLLTGHPPPGPQLKHDPVRQRPKADSDKAPDTGSFLIRITSHRRVLCDEDNLVPKWFVDCCRYAGVIHSDAPKDRVHIECRQILDDREFTRVEIIRYEI